MGKNESKDLLDVINDTYIRFGSDITLGVLGESMGASTIIYSMRYRPNVDFLIADSAYYSLKVLSIKAGKRLFHAPSFLIKLAGPIGKIFYGINYMSVRPIDGINNTNVPLLLVHGVNDSLTSYIHSKKIYEEYKGYKEIYLKEGADHSSSVLIDREGYKRKVLEFLKNIK